MTLNSSRWTQGTLLDIVKNNGLLSDGDWVETKDQDPNGDVRLIQLADIKDGYFLNKSSRYLNSRKAVTLNCTYLQAGDILIARMPDPLGRACIYPGNVPSAVTVVDVCIVRVDSRQHNSKWLMYFINSPQFRNEIHGLQSGTTRKRISKKNLSRIPLPIPHLKEQNLIVQEIETQFTRLDVAVRSLNSIKKKLDVYRNSLFKAAFGGKLSEPWRNQNQDRLKTKDQLLYAINNYDKKKTGRDKPGKLPISRLKELSALPFYWFWIEAHKICSSVRDGTHDTPKYVDRGVPLVTSKNLSRKGLNLTKIKYISKNDHHEIKKRSGVDVDDILFGMIGTIGNPIVIESDIEFSIKNVGLFKENRKLINPKYLKYWLESKVCVSLLEKLKLTKGTTQQFIPLGHLRILPVPYCEIEEQELIVDEIESRFSVINKIEQTVDNALLKSEQLRKSILKSAFEGKLVKYEGGSHD